MNENPRKDILKMTPEMLQERALHYAQEKEKVALKGELKEFLVFCIGQEEYLIEAKQVEEVLPVPVISKYPRSHQLLHGVVNVRGNLVLTVDLGLMFGLPKTQVRETSRMILINQESERTAFLADSVLRYTEFDTGLLQPPISTLEERYAELIHGLFRNKERTYTWIRVERILLEIKNRLSV